MSTEKKYQKAVFVGRFQPPHLGHIDCLRHALEMSAKVVIVIGSINVVDEMTNPLDYQTRKKMWELIAQDNGGGERIEIVGVKDYLDEDERWAREVLEWAPGVQVVFGHNEWTNTALSKYGELTVEAPKMLRKSELQGVKIREMMRRGEEGWKSRVPKEVLGQIDVRAV